MTQNKTGAIELGGFVLAFVRSDEQPDRVLVKILGVLKSHNEHPRIAKMHSKRVQNIREACHLTVVQWIGSIGSSGQFKGCP
jgi:hypothetical protein